MIKAMADGVPKDKALQQLLVTYRATPIGQEKKSPAERLHGRQPRTLLALLVPTKRPKRIENTKFQVGDKVYIKSFKVYPKWIPAIIRESIGYKMYLVQSENGMTRRHENQITKRWNTHRVDDTPQRSNIPFYFQPATMHKTEPAVTHEAPAQSVTSPGDAAGAGVRPEAELFSEPSSRDASPGPAPRRSRRNRGHPYAHNKAGRNVVSPQSEEQLGVTLHRSASGGAQPLPLPSPGGEGIKPRIGSDAPCHE